MFLQPDSELWKAVGCIAESEGLHVYDLELTRGGLRVFIERASLAESPEADSVTERVTSGDCTRLCRRLMVHCSVEGTNLGLGVEPEIEVSSPGINRELRLADHYRQAKGERVRIVASQGSAFSELHRDPLIGLLDGISDAQLNVTEEGTGKQFVVPLGDVKRAHIDFKF